MPPLYRRLLQFLKPYRARVVISMLCMSVLAACTAGLAWLLKDAIDGALGGGAPASGVLKWLKDAVDWGLGIELSMIALIPIVIVILYIIKGIAYYGQAYMMGYVGQRVIFDLRNVLYERIVNQSLSFFAHRKVGELMARITYDVTLVQAAVSTSVTALMRDSMTILFLLFVVFQRDWLLAILSLVVLPLMVFPVVKFGRKMRKASMAGQVSMGEFSSLVEETVGGIRVMKAFGMEDYEKSRFSKLSENFFGHQMRMFRVHALSFPIMELLAGFGIAGVLYYGGIRVATGETTVGTLMSFLAALLMLYEPIKRLSRANNEIQQGMASAERIFEILDEPVVIKDADDAGTINVFSKKVCFNNVALQYPGTEKPVLNGISFDVNVGEVVALVGRSGAGKTSLANLLPRFIDVTGGEVLIDGHNVREVTQASLRDQISLVTQEVILFNDSVINNIAYGHDEIDRDRVEEVAKAANAHDFIMKLPDGYDTLVGERGVILSGGQRQRLSLARALLKDSPILILDEATSSLDTESERLVQQAIDRLMEGRTVIVIAHRLSTIRHASKIIVLDGGHVAQMGSHEELLAEGGLYSELYHMQFESQEPV